MRGAVLIGIVFVKSVCTLHAKEADTGNKWPPALRGLQEDTCADDDAVFAASAAARQFSLSSCTDASTFLGLDTFCNEDYMRQAVEQGCRLTCGLCGGAMVAPGSSAPSAAPTESVANAGGDNGTQGDFPGSVEEDSGRAKAKMSDATIAVIVGVAIGAILFVTLVACAWYCFNVEGTSNKVSQVHPDPEEKTEQLFDGSYRYKKNGSQDMAPGSEEPAPKPRKGKCFVARFCRCLHTVCCYCCRRSVRRAESPGKGFGVPGDVQVGDMVKVYRLSQREYNGLLGTVISGPNEKHRYMVDVIILDDGIMTEYKAMSIKPENLRPLIVHAVAPEPDEARPSQAGGSYRSSVSANGSYRKSSK